MNLRMFAITAMVVAVPLFIAPLAFLIPNPELHVRVSIGLGTLAGYFMLTAAG